jgi:hypothetical protein
VCGVDNVRQYRARGLSQGQDSGHAGSGGVAEACLFYWPNGAAAAAGYTPLLGIDNPSQPVPEATISCLGMR